MFCVLFPGMFCFNNTCNEMVTAGKKINKFSLNGWLYAVCTQRQSTQVFISPLGGFVTRYLAAIIISPQNEPDTALSMVCPVGGSESLKEFCFRQSIAIKWHIILKGHFILMH